MEQKKNIIMRMNPMRLALYFSVIASILLRPGIGSELSFEDWAIVSSLLVPVLVPIFFMLLMLDALMSRVWLSEAEGMEVNRLKIIIRTNLILGIILLGFWVPFYVSLS